MSVERIVRRSGSRAFRVRWREHGGQRTRTFDHRADAEAWDREVKRRQQLGPLAVQQLTDRSVTLGEWIVERWTPEHGMTLERSTRTRYADVHGLHIAPTLDDLPLNALTVGVLRRWQARLVADGMKPGTVHKCRTFLSSVLRHAAEAEAIPANPLALVRAPRAEHREQGRPLAPVTVERVRAALDAERAAIVSVLAYAGLRPGELRALRWGDVRERTILVQRGADPDGRRRRRRRAPCGPYACSTRSRPTCGRGGWRRADPAIKHSCSRVTAGKPGQRRSGTCSVLVDGGRRAGGPGSIRCRACMTSGTRSPRCCSRRGGRCTTSPGSSATPRRSRSRPTVT